MTLQELNALPTAEMRLASMRSKLADQAAEITRLKGRERQLLEANNLDLERRRQAERERDNMRESWERAWTQPTADEYRERIRSLLATIGRMATALKAAETFIADELEHRKASFLPDPTEDETGYLAAADKALAEVRAAIGPPRKQQPFEYDPEPEEATRGN